MEIESPAPEATQNQPLPIADRNDPTGFLTRMQQYQLAKKQRLEAKKKQALEREEKEYEHCSFKPKINSGLIEKRTVEDLEKWGNTAKEKLKRRKMEIEAPTQTMHTTKLQQTSRSQTHTANRFVEFEKNMVLAGGDPLQGNVEDRLYDLDKAYRTNQKIKAQVYALPPMSDLKAFASTKARTPERPRKELQKSAKQAFTANLINQRNQLKNIIKKNAEFDREDEVNYISMNATNPVNSTGSAIKRRPVGLEVVKNLKQKIRDEVLS